MRIITKNNKKDFYDHMGYMYDTSDDIVYLRNTENLHPYIKEEKSVILSCYDALKGFVLGHTVNSVLLTRSRFDYAYATENVYVGIYPIVYMVPVVMLEKKMTGNGYFSEVYCDVLPYECFGDTEKTISFLCENTGAKPSKIGRNTNIFCHATQSHDTFKIECREAFKACGCPIFIMFNRGWSDTYVYKDEWVQRKIVSGHGHVGLVKNPVFSDIKALNLIKGIMDDLTYERSVYNDIENFLWSERIEPVTEPDNRTKILNHGFDLKTSFRNM